MYVFGSSDRGRRRRRRLKDRVPTWDRLDERCLLSGLAPAQLTAAYGLNNITFTSSAGNPVKGDGSGETIALVEAFHDPNLASDLQTFDSAYHLPAPDLTVNNMAGSATDPGWALEESLDVEWAHAIAPGASLLIVEASSQALPPLINAINAARSAPNVVAVSMSWGFSEFKKELSYNSVFTTPGGHTGVTFFGASGDSGAAGGPEWPSIAPSVVSVGGTSLLLNSAGAYQSESAWSGSSGGYSRFEAEPSFQRSVQQTGKRSSPDVAFLGDPGTGVNIYQTSLVTGQGSWEVVGGTSLGSPAWAAITAIVDQGRSLQGMPSLDGASQTLPALYGLAPNGYHAVAGGHRPKSFKATANTVTGLGTPVGSALISNLITYEGFVPLTTKSAAGRVAVRLARVRARLDFTEEIRARVRSFLKLDREAARSHTTDRPGHGTR